MNAATFTKATSGRYEIFAAQSAAVLEAGKIRAVEFGKSRPVLASSEARALTARRGDAGWSIDFREMVTKEVFFGG